MAAPLLDTEIMEQLQYHTLEVADLGNTWDSLMWTKDEVISYLNQRQNKFLKDSLLQVGLANIPMTAGTETYDLPWDWINTVRILLMRDDGSSKALGRSDTWEADNGVPNWSYVEGEPKLYYDESDPISVTLMPIPDDDGTLLIHYVPLAGEFDGEGEPITVPNEFMPPVKYGALADMFSKVGRANDPSRAKYCEQRYQLGVQVAKILLNGFSD